MNRSPALRFPRFHFSALPVSRFAGCLRRYFYSGWAFLIPYLAAYLLYYVMRWPVNPAAAEVRVRVESESEPWVPCLLHVYWGLHAINVVLAAVAVVAWCREKHRLGDATPPSRSVPSGDEGVAAPSPLSPVKSSQEIAEGSKQRDEGVASPSSLPPVKWLGLRFLRFCDFKISRFSARLPPSALSSPSLSLSPSLSPSLSRSLSLSPSLSLSLPPPLSPSLSLSLRIAPWFFLALLFWIPGVYLEFPADPWQHYARINEWSWLHTVGEHSTWAKSSYFLAYSLLGKIAPPTRQLFWLDFYYTGACLLLCWQYFRLARAVGLGERASMLFVILQTVLFGNNIFGFYRYYGISSSIFAQLGAVALIRVAIELASAKLQIPNSKSQRNPAEILQKETKSASAPPLALRSPVKRLGSLPSRFPFSAFQPFSFSAFASAALCAACLLALIAFNHVQGLGIAALGLVAVGVWRLIEWKRSMIWWLIAAVLSLSVMAVRFFPRDPALANYVRDGWLTHWYGFNVFAFALPVSDRALWVLGLIGLVNLAVGILLLRKNHVIGWLTVTPLIALCLPFVAIPLAGLILKHNPDEGVITFARLLFATPPSLALIALLEGRSQGPGSKFQGLDAEILQEQTTGTPTAHGKMASKQTGARSDFQYVVKAPEGDQIAANPCSTVSRFPALSLSRLPSRPPPSAFRLPRFNFRLSAFPILLLYLAALLLLPANRPFYNRLFNALMVPPEDLAMRHVIQASGALAKEDASGAEPIGDIHAPSPAKSRGLLTTPGIGYALQSTGKAWIPSADKRMSSPPSSSTRLALENLHYVDTIQVKALHFWPSDVLDTPVSYNGFLSGHWLPNEVALVHSTQEELVNSKAQSGVERRPPQLWLEWTNGRDNRHYFGEGTGVSLKQIVEDRGDITSMNGFAIPRVNAPLILEPVLRTPDGNGWKVSITVTGPDSIRRSFAETLRPRALGGDSWIFSGFEIRLPQPGKYLIELEGDTVWPTRTYRVRYTLTVADAVSMGVGN